MKTRILALFVATAGFASAAGTLQIVQTKTTTAYLAGNPQSFQFNQFDTLGGTRTLVGVTVQFEFTRSGGSLGVDNDGAVGGSVTFRHDVEGYLESSTVSVGSSDINNTALARRSSSFNLSATDGDPTNEYNTGGDDFRLFTPTSQTVDYGPESISALEFAPYIGTGTFTVDFKTIQSYSAFGVGGLQTLGLAASVTPTVTITYDYIPEPSAALLGGLGFLCLLRRRR